jgi:hypothetical protein
METGIGPMLNILGFLAAGIAVAMGWRGEMVQSFLPCLIHFGIAH